MMISMTMTMTRLVKWMLVTRVVQGLLAAAISTNQESDQLQNQLRFINKPSIKTFKTKYGEILDCIEIHKQLAFDHPLLRNHSIQMKSSRDIANNYAISSSVLKTRQLLSGNVRCPKGSVLVKRIRKEDLLGMKSSSQLGTFVRNGSSLNVNQVAQGHELATLAITSKSYGVHGNINVWGQDIGSNQFSSGSVFVASNDGDVQNNVAAGWHVNRGLYPNDNLTRLYTFWTKDSGKSTGCFNALCPGFVQVSQEITPGMVSQPLSIYGGEQYEVQTSIKQDMTTKNWWVNMGGKDVGYYPKELFTTLTGGADGVGWGGEIASPAGQPLPPMGSGHFPDEGIQKACYITQMAYIDSPGNRGFPSDADIQKVETKPNCYQAKYGGDGAHGKYMFFGGPPNCQA